MPVLSSRNEKGRFEFEKNQTILEVSLENELSHLHVCGGHGRCSTCRVQVLDGLENCENRNAIEQAMSEKLDFPDDVRLACQTKLKGDVTIRRLLNGMEDIKFAKSAIEQSGPIGSNKDVAILFADIENFTPLSERMASFDVMYLLNKYFDFAGDIVMSNGGAMNNYIGDAFLAVFGLDDTGDETFRAVKAGIEIQSRLNEFSAQVEEDFDELFKVRIGIHYGEVIVGMLGCRGTERLSVIGDTVNMAARAEAANKDADTDMLITEMAYSQVEGRVEVEDFIRMKLKGTSERTTLYEIKSVIGDSLAKENTQQKIIGGIVWHRSVPVADLKEGSKLETSYQDEAVLVFRHDGELRAIQNACTHMNLPLTGGDIDDGGNITCPFHGTAYCTKTGEVTKWCEGLPDDMPAENKAMITSIKQNPIKTFLTLESDNHVWLAEP